MRAPTVLTGLTAAAVLSACSFHANWHSDCTFEAPLARSFDLDGVHTLRLLSSSGLIEIRGAEGRADLGFDGTARASASELLERIRLDFERADGVLTLEAILPDDSNECAALDIRLELPSQLTLEIVDGDGSILLEGVGPTQITDGSGSITAQRVFGDLTITDGSGSIDLEDIDGDIVITDGSGSIDIARTGGAVRFTDGSGSVSLRDIGGDVDVEADGSGDLEFERVGGHVIVHADGSGGIEARDVTGDFRVLVDGSGGVDYERIGGRVELAD